MNAHAKRRARTKRRFAAINTLFQAVSMYAAAVAEGLTPEQALKRLQDTPIPEEFLTPAEFNAELELMRVGQRRKNGRPAKPSNTNDAVVALLREHRPDDFKGRFTLARAEATRNWLEGQKIEGRKICKTIEAVTKLVNRAKRDITKAV